MVAAAAAARLLLLQQRPLPMLATCALRWYVWQAARYLVPGLMGHQSALQDGQLMEVPDFGDPPG